MHSDAETTGENRDAVPEWFTELTQRASAADAQPPFSDQSLVDLAAGERQLLGPPGVAAAVVGHDEFELVVDPDERRRGHATRLVEQLLARPPAPTHAWAHGDHPGSRALAARFGFTPVRTLLQLRGPVRAPSAKPRMPEGMHIRAFRTGQDDAAWLDLNARAFADHPEQGRLTQRDLDSRIAESWFAADDFLLLEASDGSLAGSCWIKVVAPASGDPVGEIYAIGISPDRQGEGLGRVLMDAAFTRMADHGIRTASLYVEADNTAALRLYRAMGFVNHTIDIRYARVTEIR